MSDTPSKKSCSGSTAIRGKRDSRNVAWHPENPLFPPLSKDAWQTLENFPDILQQVRPLKAAHRKTLPGDIKELSQMLTSRRGDLRISYWSSPALASAYLYYFLPWNLIRIVRLLAALPLPNPEDNSLLLDAGSGPLTLPIALWLARPQWRKIPLRVLALDSARHPLDIGEKILSALQGSANTWRISLAYGPIQTLAGHGKNHPAGRPWLITAANVLNELKIARANARDEEPGAGFERLLEAWAPLWNSAENPEPYALFIEPGTRQGGAAIMNMRAAAQDMGLCPLSPCPHNDACPLLSENNGHSGSYAGMWCHFTFNADAPVWLRNLSSAAGLHKQSLSMSPLLLGPANARHKDAGISARVLSQPFKVPGLAGDARYACSSAGLALLENSADAPSGTLVRGFAQKNRKDRKSGAIILQPVFPDTKNCINKATFRKN